MKKPYETIIGLEVHAQLKTKTKLFCSCSSFFGASPNTKTCPVCLGLPGVLPVLNREAVKFTIMMGIATHCKIRKKSRFARKNYFYPDLPKGYQISQYDEPLCADGYIEIESEKRLKRIRIKRIHLEEDAGKNIHDDVRDITLLDFNRCGVPLIEIVSEPDIRSPQEGTLYLKELRDILVYLGICDGNMEEGSLRCDANISIRNWGEKRFGVKTEIKNLNSFKFIEKALHYEAERQWRCICEGIGITQETMLFDPETSTTKTMRSKEEAHDYRYFPEPDLLILDIGKEIFNEAMASLHELPSQKRKRFKENYGLPLYDANILTSSIELADYFEEVLKYYKNPKNVSNFIMTELLGYLNRDKKNLKEVLIKPEHIAKILSSVEEGVISSKMAKSIFEEVYNTGKDPVEVIAELGGQIKDSDEILRIVEEVVAENPDEVKKFIDGKSGVLGWLIGQVMKKTKGKANPKIVNEILIEKIKMQKKSINF